jgi:hypothetical protein
MRYYVWCDESIEKGKFFSDFYGGVIINKEDFEEINTELTKLFLSFNLGSELKWSKINDYQKVGYMKMMDLFFRYIKDGKLKIRIMFTETKHNATPQGKSDEKFLLLYYQFIKHAFGFQFMDNTETNHIEFFFDDIPDKEEKKQEFKKFICDLQNLPEFQKAKVIIKIDEIAEVKSHKHILLQCLDVVLGAMATRLNKLNLIKPEGQRRRGKRTIAKEKVFKHILALIKTIQPNFRIATNTWHAGDTKNVWLMAYRHWIFKRKGKIKTKQVTQEEMRKLQDFVKKFPQHFSLEKENKKRAPNYPT